MPYRVAVLGATGLVGRTMLQVLEDRAFPVAELRPLASSRRPGRVLSFQGDEIPVREATPDAFDGIDLVLASAGGAASLALLPEAAARGAVSVDNSSAFRMADDVPLVVPEVNPERIHDRPRGIIANPNCSTIQLVVALEPLRRAAGLRRVVVSTYQSVSGAGQQGIAELEEGSRAHLAGGSPGAEVFPRPIAFDCLPHIDRFLEDGSTREEWKMQVETAKILGAPIPVTATCVRVPVTFAHSEAVWIETEAPLSPNEARRLLAAAPGVRVVDDPGTESYPTAADAAGRDEVLVGRLRRDPTVAHGLVFWVVADNLRKGAATNAVQIAELLAAAGLPGRS